MADDPNDNDSRVPALNQTGFDCPRCGTYANQGWTKLYRQTGGSVAEFKDSRPPQPSSWSVAFCARCRNWSVWRDSRMMYPTSGLAPAAHADMPPEAKSLYEEAREVVGISRRAGTALARAALERLLKTLDAEAGRVNLATRIERIHPKVPAPLGQMLTIIRVAGNSSLHVDDEQDDVLVLVLDQAETEIVDLIFESINDLVEELIAKPRKVADLYGRVPESIRERVEKAQPERLSQQ